MDITEKLEALLPAPASYGGSEASQTITDAKHEIFKLRGLLDQALRERDEVKRILLDCINRGSDARVSDECSLSFLADAPREFRFIREQRDQAMGIVAVIMRDGGHYASANGNTKAINAAHLKWAKTMTLLDEISSSLANILALTDTSRDPELSVNNIGKIEEKALDVYRKIIDKDRAS